MKHIILLILLIPALSCTSPELKIHEWRGENRSGIYQETQLLKEWPAKGPEELWYLEGIGSGFGSPVVADGRIYITGAIDSTAWLHCISAEGTIVWKTALGTEWVTSFPGSRSAPTIAGDMIYVSTGMGNLYCLEKANGNRVWSRDFLEDFQGVYPLHGHSEAVATEGDRVYWTPGGEKYNVVALNRFTGELIWSNPGHGEYSAYNHPRIIRLPERNILVTFSAYHLMGLDTGTGELLWSHEQTSYPPEKRAPGYGDTHANTVLYDDGSIYYAAGDGNCGVKLDLSKEGSEITEVWRNYAFDSYMGGIVKIGNLLYGGTTNKPGLLSVNAASGQQVDSLKIGRGAIIAADQMLYYYNWKGELHLVRYSEGKMEKVSSFKVTRGSNQRFSHPVIRDGVLYQRHGDVLMAYDISFS